jgi:hypothetical protein
VSSGKAAQTRFHSNKRRYNRTPEKGRHYVLAGRLLYGRCGRRMEGTWNHDRAYYRCQAVISWRHLATVQPSDAATRTSGPKGTRPASREPALECKNIGSSRSIEAMGVSGSGGLWPGWLSPIRDAYAQANGVGSTR